MGIDHGNRLWSSKAETGRPEPIEGTINTKSSEKAERSAMTQTQGSPKGVQVPRRLIQKTHVFKVQIFRQDSPPGESPQLANSEQEILVNWVVTKSNVCFGFQINAHNCMEIQSR